MISIQTLEEKSYYEDRLRLIMRLVIGDGRNMETLIQNRDKVMQLVRQYRTFEDQLGYNPLLAKFPETLLEK